MGNIDVAVTARRAKVRYQVLSCTRCPLHKRCSRPVPLHVPEVSSPPFAVVGEAPGKVEDHKGRPMTGPAGRQMRRLLRAAGLDPSAAAWLNVVSCWPHGTPDIEHLELCDQNLWAQLDAVNTPFVVAAGAVAWGRFVPDVELRDLHGHMVRLRSDLWIMGVWHPARVLREPDLRHEVVNDLERLRLVTDSNVPQLAAGDRCVICRVSADHHDDRMVPYCTRHIGQANKRLNIQRTRRSRVRTKVNQRAQMRLVENQ